VWSPLAGGLLSGKYRRDREAPEGTRQVDPRWDEPPIRDRERLYDIIEVLVGVADGRGVSPAQVALAYLLRKPGVSTLVIGARRDDQLQDNLGAAQLTLDDDEFAALDKVSAPYLIYPHWHQARFAADRLSDADRALLGQHIAAG
jgi:aryl-alcohol dehydrogenase-like predicted oxidoreductase